MTDGCGLYLRCNAISAYHRDHLFMPVKRTQEALSLLKQLSAHQHQSML